MEEAKVHIFYLFREELYQSALNYSCELLSKFHNDPFFMLCRLLALIMLDSNESNVDLNVLKSHNDFCLTTAIISKQLKLDSLNRDLRSSATESDLYHSSFTLYVFKHYSKALDFVEKLTSTVENLNLKGWILLKQHKIDLEVVKIFELSLKDEKRNLDGALGLSEAFMYTKDTEESLSTINKTIVRFPSSILPITAKIKLHFLSQDWENCNETINRALNLETNNLIALLYSSLIFVLNNDEKSVGSLQNLFTELKLLESTNFTLILKLCRLFGNICGRNPEILQETSNLVEFLLKMRSNNINCLIECANQNILQGNVKEAAKLYKSATKIDNECIDGLIGITYCEYLIGGINEQFKQQMEFLSQLDGAIINPKFIYLNSLRKNLQALINLCHLFVNIKIPFNCEYLYKLEPDFLLLIIKEIFTFIPQTRECILKQRQITQITQVTEEMEKILEIVAKACPHLYEAAYLLSRLQIINGRQGEAAKNLEKIVERNATYVEAYLLLGQILVNSGQHERAFQMLEIGLSHNFTLRENASYYYIIGLIEKNRNKINEAITALTTSLNFTDFNKVESGKSIDLTLSDKASICIQLIDAHLQANQLHEATKLIEDASREFEGTAEESRLLILIADQALDRNDVQGAIDILGKIKSSEAYYLSAKSKLAKIFLNTKKDYKGYLKCYQEVVEIDPGPESFLCLGDAYLNVLNIQKALESYEKALKCSPNDLFLITKMGWALETTHRYQRAVKFYKETINATNFPELKLKLITLYTNLKQFKEAELLVVEEIDNEKLDDLISLQNKAKLFNVLVTINEKSNNSPGAMKALKDAKENQKRVIKRMMVEDSGSTQIENENMRNINLKLAKLASSKNLHDEAIFHYKEALTVSPHDKELYVSLAELYMKLNKLELCQQTCAVLLSLEPNSEEASIMMADIAFRKVDFDMASIHFTNIVNQQPTNWKALVRFIEVQRRTGGLDEVLHYLQQAEKSIDIKDSGFNFCMAQYEWYSSNLNAALRHFNNARHDSTWGKQATINMIEICLNPEDELFGDQLFDTEDSEYRDSRSMALQTADRLLRDLRQKSSTDEEYFKCRILSNFLLLASKEKHNIERALEDLATINSTDEVYKEHISVILAVATAHTLLKQGQRAKNQLKRIVKTPWTFEDAEHLERCWLLLADYYIQSSKYDLASELLQRVMLHNRACVKALEFSGIIAEKEQIYKHAANYYDSAWKYSGKQNPIIGYKLAYSYMKCKKYAEAIDACQQVLKHHPEYPRIKKDIMDKCLNNLRT